MTVDRHIFGWGTLVAGVFSAATISHAAEFEKNIMTGGPKGTYIQIGKNIAGLMDECGQTLNVVESAGSLENFAAVRNRRNTQFGIVQSDLLEYLKTFEASDSDVQQAVRGVRIMYPLYNEEVHVLARNGIADLAGLKGQKVAVGVKDSGTFLTASLVLDIVGAAAERVEINPSEALPKLKSGEIDALFYVAGAPASLFADEDIDGDKFHLLPIKEAPLLATYTPTSIKSGTYSFQDEDVDLVAVKAVMMTFDYDPDKNAYHRESCKAVSDVASLVINNLDKLQTTGHAKWQTVDLTDLPPGWQVGSCVKVGMALDYKPECKVAATPKDGGSGGGNEDYLKLLKERIKKGNL